jgi:amidase
MVACMLVVVGCSPAPQPPAATAPRSTTTTTGADLTMPATTTATTALERFDPLEATILDLQRAMDRGSLTAVELIDFYLARIAAYDASGPALGAFITVNPRARDEAAALDAERAVSGPRGPLHGIPVVVKDNMNTTDMPTTGGTASLAGFLPGDDAHQVERLRAAGAVILGKANLHELARDITTVSSLGGQSLNPYDPARNPGGSSGGTAVAVSANLAAVGLGTDTCGSIRLPAAHTNLFGLRPTVGLSSRAGVMPLAPTEDTVGPIARTVSDLAIVLDATVGFDPADPTTVPTTGSFVDALDPSGLAGRRIGVVDALFAGSDPEVSRVVRAALDEMTELDAVVIDVSMPNLDALRGDAATVLLREFRFAFDDYLAAYPHAPVSSLAELVALGVHHPAVDSQLRRAVAVATLDTPAYRAALARRDAVRDAVIEVMDRHRLDALAYPTSRHPAAPIGSPQRGNNCATASVAGLPAITVPAGLTAEGLPVGIEVMGLPFAEHTLLAIASGFEAHTDHRRLPPTTPPLP